MHKLKKKKKKMFVKNTRGKPTFNSHVVNTNNQFPIRKWEDNPITGQYLLSRNYIIPSNGSLLNSILKHQRCFTKGSLDAICLSSSHWSVLFPPPEYTIFSLLAWCSGPRSAEGPRGTYLLRLQDKLACWESNSSQPFYPRGEHTAAFETKHNSILNRYIKKILAVREMKGFYQFHSHSLNFYYSIDSINYLNNRVNMFW